MHAAVAIILLAASPQMMPARDTVPTISTLLASTPRTAPMSDTLPVFRYALAIIQEQYMRGDLRDDVGQRGTRADSPRGERPYPLRTNEPPTPRPPSDPSHVRQCRSETPDACLSRDWICFPSLIDCIHPDQIERHRMLLEALDHLIPKEVPSRDDIEWFARERASLEDGGEVERAAGIARRCDTRVSTCVQLRDFIDNLEHLAPLRPGDVSKETMDWFFRQRVSWAVKSGELERALAIAGSCSGTEWWCMALRGFAEQRIDPSAGVPAFDSALSRMPGWARREWLDVSTVAPGISEVQGATESSDPDLMLFWWLADPLWSRSGNERYADQLSRRLMLTLEGDVYDARVRNCDWSEYFAQGVPNSWEWRKYHGSPEGVIVTSWIVCSAISSVRASTLARQQRTQIERLPPSRDVRALPRHLVRYVYGGYSFVPDSLRFRAPLESTAEDWAVEWNTGDERLVTHELWYNLDDQTAVLRRGANLRVLAAAQLAPPLDTATELTATLALGRPDDLSVTTTSGRIDGLRTFRVTTTVDSAQYMASIEVVGKDAIGRARHGAPAPAQVDGFGLSDLALVAVPFGRGEMTLEDALLPSLRLASDEKVGLYFEVYGVPETEALGVTLTAGKLSSPGFFGRLMRAFHLKREAEPVHVTWQERAEPGEEGRLERFFELDTSGLDSGENRLTLTVTRADGRTASVSREMRVGG